MGKISARIGLMSGTSMDGIDVALIETDGERIVALRAGRLPALSGRSRERCCGRRWPRRVDLTRSRRAAGRAGRGRARGDRAARRGRRAVSRRQRIAAAAIDVIGFHGQTVLHRPERRLTVQIGDGAALAQRPASRRLRSARRRRRGGRAGRAAGAGLSPRAGRDGSPQRPIAVVNIGGVANVTWIDGGRADRLRHRARQRADRRLDARAHRRSRSTPTATRPRRARSTRTGRARSAHPFFAAPLPKSLDRNAFAVAGRRCRACRPSDGAATLTAFTAASMARVVQHLPKQPRSWIVAGGGARNPTLMQMLARAACSRRPSRPPTRSAGRPTRIEAQAFGFLAVRRLKGLPITYPATTGCRSR